MRLRGSGSGPKYLGGRSVGPSETDSPAAREERQERETGVVGVRTLIMGCQTITLIVYSLPALGLLLCDLSCLFGSVGTGYLCAGFIIVSVVHRKIRDSLLNFGSWRSSQHPLSAWRRISVVLTSARNTLHEGFTADKLNLWKNLIRSLLSSMTGA